MDEEQFRLQQEQVQRWMELKRKKKEVGRLSRVLIYYSLAMVIPTLIYETAYIFYLAFRYAEDIMVFEREADRFITEFVNQITKNGWFYIISLILGFIILIIYRGKKLFTEDIAGKRAPMKVSTFFLLVVLLLAPNTLVTMFSLGSEVFLNLFGLTADGGILNLLSSDGMNWSMLLYIILLGPIMEEILFRGVVLHKLEKYGRVFAIFISTLCFGIFHGNLTQGLFAIAVGVLLGYVALEYSVKWSIVLHVFNNALSMGLDKLINTYPKVPIELITFVAFALITVLGILILLANKQKLGGYVKEHPTAPGSKALVYGNPWFIVFLCLYFVMFIMYITQAISRL